MRKTLTIVALFVFIAFSATAQQDAMFTKYMFNSLVYNPGYAGSKDHLAVGLLHRTQWSGIDGGPSTQSFTIHTPLRSERVGVGLSAVNDAIGPTNSIGANISYAYRIPMGKGKLAIGLQGGVQNWRADWSKLNLEDVGDEAFEEVQPSYWLPNFGAGVYYYSKYFYAGVSAPHLVEYDLRQNVEQVGKWAKTYRHYFGTIGAAIPVGGESFIFKPSILIKNVGLFSSLSKDENFENIGAPTAFDVDFSMLFYQSFWFGVSYRSAFEAIAGDTSDHDSIDFWASYYMSNGLRIGAAYDYTLTKLQQPGQGAFEVMLGYEFNYKTKKAVTPRYF